MYTHPTASDKPRHQCPVCDCCRLQKEEWKKTFNYFAYVEDAVVCFMA